jgi:3-oxoacyl-[acyl-carrier protein] reductase
VDLGIRGKIALVTGGSYGIGRAIALALAAEGCAVAICARGRERLEHTAAEIRAMDVPALAVVADTTDPSSAASVVERIDKEWGALHILVNNAGGGGERVPMPVEDVPQEKWIALHERNAMATVRFTMSAIPHMRRARFGRVVAITSVQGKEGGGRPWYTMSKSAQISLMKTLALDRALVRDGLTFNSVASGRVIFDGNEWDRFRQEDPVRFRETLDARLPMGRAGTPEEIAAVVAFACSAQSSLLNGACIAVDGGESYSF